MENVTTEIDISFLESIEEFRITNNLTNTKLYEMIKRSFNADDATAIIESFKVLFETFDMGMLLSHYYDNKESFKNGKRNITINGDSYKLSFEDLPDYGTIAYWQNDKYMIRANPYFDLQDGNDIIPLHVEVTDCYLNLIGRAEAHNSVTSYDEYVKFTIKLAEHIFSDKETNEDKYFLL